MALLHHKPGATPQDYAHTQASAEGAIHPNARVRIIIHVILSTKDRVTLG